MVTKIIIAGVGLVIAFCVWYLYQGMIDRELETARRETDIATKALNLATAYTKTVQAELDEVLHASVARIAKADASIAWLKDTVARTRAELDTLHDEKQALLDEIETLELAGIPDAPIEDILAKGAELYPRQDLSGMKATANEKARGLFLMMMAELEQRRALSITDHRIIEDYQSQTYRLEMVIDAHEKKYLALNEMNAALLTANEALANETAQYYQVNQALKKQVGIYEKKLQFGWMQKPALAGALIAGLMLGKVLIK